MINIVYRLGFWSWKQDLARNLCSLVATPQRNDEGVSGLLSQLLSLCLASLI